MSYDGDQDDCDSHDGCCSAIEYMCICGPFWDCVLENEDYGGDDNSILSSLRVKSRLKAWRQRRDAARRRRSDEVRRRLEEEYYEESQQLLCGDTMTVSSSE